MDAKLILFSGYEILLSIIFGLGSIFIFLKVFDLVFMKTKADKKTTTRQKEPHTIPNIAIGILKGTIIVSLLLLIQSSIIPSVNTLRVMVGSIQQIKPEYIFISFGYFILFYIIAIIISILLIFITIKIYTLATTKVDEIHEIKQNNIAIAILMSLVIIGMALFMKPAVQHFLSSLIHYDAIEATITPDPMEMRIYSDNKEENPEEREYKIDKQNN